jgi:lipoate-protein ligase A
MAVDEAILEAVGSGVSLPTLRLYAWQPACLSLGYAQPASDVDRGSLARLGWELVRRPTGGRAILHTDELTYSVIGPADELRLAGGVLASYRRLSAALLAGLHLLGIPAESKESTAPPGNESKGAVCFEAPSSYEITVHGKKLIGSAQARRKESVLQHGTFPLEGDLKRILQVLVFPDEASRLEAAARLEARATTAEAVLGYPLPWEKAAGVFRQAFSQVLNLELATGDLTLSERSHAGELMVEKYANEKWVLRI